MPITYHRAKDGTLYPTYSGKEAEQQVRDYVRKTAPRLGETVRHAQQRQWLEQNPPDPHQLLPTHKIPIMLCLFGLTYLGLGFLVWALIRWWHGFLRNRAY